MAPRKSPTALTQKTRALESASAAWAVLAVTHLGFLMAVAAEVPLLPLAAAQVVACVPARAGSPPTTAAEAEQAEPADASMAT